MKRLLPRNLQQAIQWAGSKFDSFFAGRWYWALKRRTAERRLEKALDQHGDQSMHVRRATEQYRRSDFAVRYWRSAPAPVMQVAEQARNADMPMEAIRLVVLNADLRIKDGRVYLRRPFIVTALNAVLATIVGVHMFLMCLMAVTATGPTWLKVLVILAVAFVYCFLYYGWSLYTSRPQQILAKHGHALDALCVENAKRPHANVHDLVLY